MCHLFLGRARTWMRRQRLFVLIKCFKLTSCSTLCGLSVTIIVLYLIVSSQLHLEIETHFKVSQDAITARKQIADQYKNNDATILTQIGANADPIMQLRQNFITQMMKDAWDDYAKHAWGYNELRPVSKSTHYGHGFEGSKFGLTIIDSLDTLYIMGMHNEYEAARKWIKYNLDFSTVDVHISVFETNIRVLGGLLSIYSLTQDELYLNLAYDLGKRLLPAFGSPTGLPYKRINLKTRSHSEEQYVSLAAVGTLFLEFYYLSEITKDPTFTQKVDKIREILLSAKSNHGLYYGSINVKSGHFSSSYASLGAGSDSFYEYLLKSAIQTGDDGHYSMYNDAVDAIVSDGMIKTSSQSHLLYIAEYSSVFGDEVSHLACFAGGMFALGAIRNPQNQNSDRDLDIAKNFTNTCHESYIRTATRIGPEIFEFSAHKEASPLDQEQQYILRPEVIESYFILYRITGDVKYREWAWDAALAIEKHCKVGYRQGYSGIPNVLATDGGRMKQWLYLLWGHSYDVQQSFFLAETLKYLYLIFSPDELIDLNYWVFNTEAHPLPIKNSNPMY